MSSIFQESISCFICGENSTQFIIESTSAFGSPDLDTRPSEIEKSTISYQIQICPNCFYCAPDIRDGNEKIKKIVTSEEYKHAGRDLNFSDKSLAFLLHSFVLDKLEKYEKAAWACLHAAWYCDDDEMDFEAGLCRKKAFDAFNKAKELETNILSEPKGSFDALMVDILRRIPDLPKANDYCIKAIKRDPDEMILKILNFQKELIENRDSSCYTIAEAMQ